MVPFLSFSPSFCINIHPITWLWLQKKWRRQSSAGKLTMHSSQINLNFLACLHMKRENISLWHHKSFIHKTYIRKLSINACTIFVDVLFITSLYVKISFQRILLFWMYHFISFNPLVEDLDIGCALCLHRHGDYRKNLWKFFKEETKI